MTAPQTTTACKCVVWLLIETTNVVTLYPISPLDTRDLGRGSLGVVLFNFLFTRNELALLLLTSAALLKLLTLVCS